MAKVRKPFPVKRPPEPPKQRFNMRMFASQSTLLRGEGSATILVLSGTLAECMELVEAHNIVLWAFVRKELTIRKYSRLSRVIKYGTYASRPDLREIEETITKRNLIVDVVGKRKDAGSNYRDRFAGHVTFPTLEDLE